MAVTLKNGSLTTLATLKDALGITVSTYDDKLKRAINVATGLITRWCGRSFHRESFTDERYPWKGGVRLVLKRAPILTLTSIEFYQSTTPLDSTLWEIEDATAGIVYLRATIPTFARTRWGIAQDGQPGTEPPDMLVTYEAGYVTPEQADTGGAFDGQTVTLPDEIEQAAIELAAHIYSTPVGFAGGEVQSETLGDASISYRADEGTNADKAIPPYIRSKLSPFKAVVIV